MYDIFWPLKVALSKAYCVDPDVIQHYAAFHLGLLHFIWVFTVCQSTSLIETVLWRTYNMPFG